MKNIVVLPAIVLLAAVLFVSCSDPDDALFGEGDGIKVAAAPVMDTYIRFPAVTTNYGKCENLKIGTGPVNEVYRGLMQFDLKGIPAGVSIEYASLTVSCAKVSGTVKISAYPVTTFWQEGISPCDGYATFNATWVYANDTGPGGRTWYNQGGDYLPTAMSDKLDIKAAGTYTFILDKAIVKAWVDDWTVNYGLIIISDDEVNMNESIILSSRETGGSATLRIRYK